RHRRAYRISCARLPLTTLQRYGRCQRLSNVETTMAGMADGPRPGKGAVPALEDVGPAITVTDLFREHPLELVRLALVMVGDLATAEDTVQDAFERLHRRWHGLREPA